VLLGKRQCGQRGPNLFQRRRTRCPQRDFIHPRPVQSLPPLRAFLREEGIDTDIEPRRPCHIGSAHEVAREDARRRALRAATTRYGSLGRTEAKSHRFVLSYHTRMSPLLGYEHRNAASVSEQRPIRPLEEVHRPGYNRRLALISPSRVLWRMKITGIVTAENRPLIRKLFDGPYRLRLPLGMTLMLESLRPYDHMGLGLAPSRSVCPEKWRRSREHPLFLWWMSDLGTLTFKCRPPPPVPPNVRDEAASPIPSRKRLRPAYLESVPSTIASLSVTNF
jgi:hypothetical protein